MGIVIFFCRDPDDRPPEEKQRAFERGAWRLCWWILALLVVGGLADLLGLT